MYLHERPAEYSKFNLCPYNHQNYQNLTIAIVLTPTGGNGSNFGFCLFCPFNFSITPLRAHQGLPYITAPDGNNASYLSYSKVNQVTIIAACY